MADDLKVITGECRISFPHLFEAVPQRDSDGKVREDAPKKFSVLLLIPKKDKKTIAALRRAQAAALEAGVTSKFGGKKPKNWTDTIHDCDEEDDLEQYPEREGHYRLSVSANEGYPPGVVDQSVSPILDRTEVYSGCYMRASLVAYPYRHPQSGPGVSFGLRNIQKMRDGDPLGGVVTKAEDDFDEVETDEEDMI